MFIEKLNMSEREALCQLIVSIAYIDGKVTDEENSFIKNYCLIAGVEKTLSTEMNIERACEQLMGETSKIVALQEVVKIAVCDGTYDQSERQGAYRIAAALGVNEQKFLEIEKWVLDGHEWALKGEAMLVA